MSRIVLTNNYDTAELPRDSRTVWLHHPCERVNTERAVNLKVFMDDAKAAVRDADLLVVCSLITKLCTPSNRVRLGQFLTEPWFGPRRISIDRCLFIGEPWRMWWHFGCVAQPFGDYFTSYRLESDWRRYIETDTGNPCTLDVVERHGWGCIEWRNGFRFDPPLVRTEAMGIEAHARYRTEKARAFDEETTSGAIIKRLADFAQREYPFRRMPRNVFETTRAQFNLTDFAVDQYLLKRALELIDLTNGIAESFAC